MNFTIPSTKAQMYTTLKSIYNFYRLNSTAYTGEQRSDLVLGRLSFTPLSNTSLMSKAENIVLPKIERERQKAKLEIEKQIATLRENIVELNKKYLEVNKKLNEDFIAIKEKLKEEASKKGLSYSSLTTEKMFQAEKDKNEKELEIQLEQNEKTTEINSKITALNNKISGIDDFYDDLLVMDKNAKFLELQDEQDKTKREIDEFNFLQAEKETKYHNSNLSSDANLELKFLEIQSKGLSKEALVDAGYYADVVSCITGYYNTLSAVNAFNDIKGETGLIMYLEDFYQDLVYNYKIRAQS